MRQHHKSKWLAFLAGFGSVLDIGATRARRSTPPADLRFPAGAFARAMEEVEADLEAVGESLRIALRETARELGGSGFSEQVMAAAGSDPFPRAKALELLEACYPGSADRVRVRLSQIEERSRARVPRWRR